MNKILIADDHPIVRKGLKQLLLEQYAFADIGEAGDVEAGIAALQTVRAIGAGDLEVVQAEVLVDVNVLRAEALAGKTDVAVEQQASTQGVGTAD